VRSLRPNRIRLLRLLQPHLLCPPPVVFLPLERSSPYTMPLGVLVE
jgi:hypothetical protein